jgi:hypothetical protein
LHAIAEDAARAHCLDSGAPELSASLQSTAQNAQSVQKEEVGWSLHALRRGIWPAQVEACATVNMPASLSSSSPSSSSSASSTADLSVGSALKLPRWVPTALQSAVQSIADSHRAKWPSRKLHLCPQVLFRILFQFTLLFRQESNHHIYMFSQNYVNRSTARIG